MHRSALCMIVFDCKTGDRPTLVARVVSGLKTRSVLAATRSHRICVVNPQEDGFLADAKAWS